MAKRPKPPVLDETELNQQVSQIRPQDQFTIIQGGRSKVILASSIFAAIKQALLNSSEIDALMDALANKAPLNHNHDITDLNANFYDAVPPSPTTYASSFPVLARATVSGGNAVFNLTHNDLPGGNAIFPNGPVLNSPMFRAVEGINPHAFGDVAWSNSDKTLTVPVSRTGNAVTIAGISVLGANVPANGSVIYALVWGR